MRVGVQISNILKLENKYPNGSTRALWTGSDVTVLSMMEGFLFARSDAPVLQPVWNWVRQSGVLHAAPLWGACIALSAHVVFSVLFLILDLLGPRVSWISQYRLNEKPVSLRRWCHCLVQICCKFAAGVLPVSACIHFARTRSGLMETKRAAPSLFDAWTQCFTSLLVFDTLFFIIHYSAHRVPWLYQKFHRFHHMNRNPFALAAMDSSVSELVGQQVLAMLSSLLVGCHPLSEIMFHLLNIWLAVEDHCGYDFPWATHRLLPCFGGPTFHQAHHRHLNGNYAPYFRHWDLIFGTVINV